MTPPPPPPTDPPTDPPTETCTDPNDPTTCTADPPDDPPPPPPPPDYDPTGWTPEQLAAWEAFQNLPTVAQPDMPSQPNSADAAEELDTLRAIFADALYVYQMYLGQANNSLGQGYIGNIMHTGPTCDVVMNDMKQVIDYVTQHDFAGQTFDARAWDHYTFATIFASPLEDWTSWTGYDGTLILDHTYVGIYNVETQKLEYFMDPWRSGAYFDATPIASDPNWSVKSWTTWTYAPYVANPIDGPPQDPIQGSPPGDDGHWLIH
jgi:hypothetical protein